MRGEGEAKATTVASKAYDKPPWRFHGRAVYQLHLVKSQVAQALIPKEFRLIQAFGYTLGGFFLANYDDTPAGVFDELVIIAGIVWNPPTSCAWASKVLVNSNEACLHGRTDVGLPSHVARFTKRITTETRQQAGRYNGFLNKIGLSSTPCSSTFDLETEVTETKDPASTTDIFSINILSSVPKENSKVWLGPHMKMSLPSFSGRTQHNPNLLKYSCQMECRVRLVHPLQISSPRPTTDYKTEQQATEDQSSNFVHRVIEETKENKSTLSLMVMLSKPILALEFNCLSMNVEAPVIISE